MKKPEEELIPISYAPTDSISVMKTLVQIMIHTGRCCPEEFIANGSKYKWRGRSMGRQCMPYWIDEHTDYRQASVLDTHQSQLE
eukprot:scaffold15295_cov20-Prasinocladus_malaysianus.AAC.1